MANYVTKFNLGDVAYILNSGDPWNEAVVLITGLSIIVNSHAAAHLSISYTVVTEARQKSYPESELGWLHEALPSYQKQSDIYKLTQEIIDLFLG